MASRGKWLVQLALQKQQPRDSPMVQNICSDKSTSDEKLEGLNKPHEDEARLLCSESDISENLDREADDTRDSPMVQNICLNKSTSDEKLEGLSKLDDDEARLLCSESDISEDLDQEDDDPRDPDWKASKRDLVASESDEDDRDDLITQTKTTGTRLAEVPDTVDKSTNIDHEEIVQTSDQVLKRKRKKLDPSRWKRNVQKRLRMEGKAFQGFKKHQGKYTETDKSGRILTDRGCSKRCQKSGKNRQCNLVSEEERREIFGAFWNDLDWHGKQVFVVSLVDCKTVSGDGKRRKMSLVYHLKSKGVKFPVCKPLFLSTLGIGEKMVYGWIENAKQNIGTPNKPVTKPRGKHADLTKCEVYFF